MLALSLQLFDSCSGDFIELRFPRGRKLKRKLFGTSGIRGVYNKEIDYLFAYNLGLSLATYFEGGKALVGRDCRFSSDPLSLSLVTGILEGGADVDLSGITSTPAFQCYVKKTGSYNFSVMVTASHNPPEYNGFKLYTRNGLEAYEDIEEKIEDLLLNRKFSGNISKIGKFIYIGNVINTNYVDSLCELFETEFDSFSIVVDLCGCSSIMTIPPLLDRLNIKYFTINDKLDQYFKICHPEPRPEILNYLGEKVVSKQADLGVAFDGDGDRAIFSDEKGKVWWGDVTGILIGKFLVEVGETKYVVTPITSTIATELTIEKVGGKVIRTRVGGKNIVREMIRLNSKWGFEENGGGVYGPHIYGRDGGITLLLLLKALKYYGKPLSSLLSEIPQYYQIKEKINIQNREMFKQVLHALLERYSRYDLDMTEGIKIFFKEDTWVLVRPSGTEPVIRIFSEARSLREAKENFRKIKKDILNLIS